jgi:hypothetical protein
MATIGKGAANQWTRRDLLRAGGLGALGLGLDLDPVRAGGDSARSERAVILLMLVGGPSQLDSFDPKPEAPAEVRGPFGSIATAVPGVRVCEHLPRLAQRLNRLALIRSLRHEEAPIHETGYQLVQTGRLSRSGEDHPHVGSVAAWRLGRAGAPPFVLLPRPIGNTGVGIWRGQSAGPLGPGFDPVVINSDGSETAGNVRLSGGALGPDPSPKRVRDAYGSTPFGRDCLTARRLVEAGARVVTVNMYDTVFDQVSWDCHGSAHFSTLEDYAREVLPTFDRAFTALIDDLDRLGLLDTTLVVATGEFGRSPRLNQAGGRDHWPGVWSAIVAGGGTSGGQVIGASDRQGGEPADRPVTPQELVATMYQALALDVSHPVSTTDGRSLRLVDEARPITELIG